MNIQLLNYIIQPLLGGLAGYITNEYAINMLFYSYTPLKIGGVIPKTRNEFIENISRLIEEDVINKDKIEAILCDKTFIENFDRLVEDFFTKSLYEASDNTSLGSIDSMSEMSDEIISFINNRLKVELPNILNVISEQICPKKLLSKQQINDIISNLYTIIVQSIKNNDITDTVINNLLSSNENLPVSEIIGNELTDKLIKNISCTICDIASIKAICDEDITKWLKEALLRTNLYSSIRHMLSNILFSNRTAILQTIAAKTDSIVRHKAFHDLIYDFSSIIINFGKSVNIPLSQLINESFIDSIKPVIIESAPCISSLIIEFAEENNIELKLIIEEAIEETINEQDKAKKALLGMIKGSVLNTVKRKDIAKTVEKILNDAVNIESISTALVKRIQHLLANTTVADLVCLSEKNEILNQSKLADFITGLIIKNAVPLSERLYDSIPSVFKSSFLTDMFYDKTVDLIKEKLIYSDKTLKSVVSALYNYMTSAISHNLCRYADEISSYKDFIQAKLSYAADEKRVDIIDVISNSLYDFLKDKNVKDLISASAFDKICRQAVSLSEKEIKSLKNKVSQLELYELYNKINHISNIQKNSSEALRAIIINNLEDLLQGFIKSVTTSNLNKLNDEKLCEMAKSFMGNNLKPIMLFGGMLGVIAGFILAAIHPEADLTAVFSLSGAITYALVGYLTNAIAINMLFKPYKQIKAIRSIPFLKHFSLGYIVKNKAVLADNMSYAIKEYLLTKDSMDELIGTNSVKIKSSMLKSLSKDNYQLLKGLVKSNKISIAKGINNGVISLFNANMNSICGYITKLTEGISLVKLLSNNQDKINNYIKGSQNKLDNIIFSELKRIKENTSSIESVLPDSIIASIKKAINNSFRLSLSNITDKINYDSLKSLSYKYDGNYKLFLNKSIKDIISSADINKLTASLTRKLSGMGIDKKLADSINLALNSDKQSGQLFKGEIGRLSNKALNSFFDSCDINSKKLLIKLKPGLSGIIQDNITANLNFLAKGAYNMMNGNSIVDTVVEKVLTDKLPLLIKRNKDSLLNKATDVLNNKLLTLRINRFGLSVNQEAMHLVSGSIPLNDFAEKINSCCSDIKLRDILAPLQIDSPDKAFNNYKNEISELIDELKVMVNISKDDMSSRAQDIVSKYISHTIKNTAVHKLFEDIDTDLLKKISSNISGILLNDSFLNKSINDIIHSIEADNKALPITNIADRRKLEQMVKSLLKNLLTNNNLINQLEDSTLSIIDAAVKDSFAFISDDAKNYCIGLLTDAGIITLRNNLSDILNKIRFDTVAKEQINAMEPKKIHNMFNSFAGKYFKRLMLYGLLGCVFGINTIAGIGLAGIYGISHIVSKILKILDKNS